MQEIHETPRNILVAALFCAIIGIIAYAGFDSGMVGHKTKNLLAGSKIPTIHDEAHGFPP